jgi:hypothetical protein
VPGDRDGVFVLVGCHRPVVRGQRVHLREPNQRGNVQITRFLVPRAGDLRHQRGTLVLKWPVAGRGTRLVASAVVVVTRTPVVITRSPVVLRRAPVVFTGAFLVRGRATVVIVPGRRKP